MRKQTQLRKTIRQGAASLKDSPANKGSACTSSNQSIVLHLSKVTEIKAIFARTDEDGVCHVFSVVEEHSPATYQKVMKAERRIERDFPEMRFSFRIRAHQGREPALAVPLFSQPLFTR